MQQPKHYAFWDCRAKLKSCLAVFTAPRLCCSNPLRRRQDLSMALGAYVVHPNGTAPNPVCQKARMTFPSTCNRLARMYCSKGDSSQSVAKRCRMEPQIAVNSCRIRYCYRIDNTKHSGISSPQNATSLKEHPRQKAAKQRTAELQGAQATVPCCLSELPALCT